MPKIRSQIHIEKCGGVRKYVPEGVAKEAEMTLDKRIVWFTRGPGDIWLLWGEGELKMEGKTREEVFGRAGAVGKRILEKVLSMRSLKFVNLSPRTPVSRGVLAVGKKPWRTWWGIERQIVAALTAEGFEVIR